MTRIRQKEIHARRVRKKKMTALRARYRDAKSGTHKEHVVAKAARVAPWISEEEFVALAKRK